MNVRLDDAGNADCIQMRRHLTNCKRGNHYGFDVQGSAVEFDRIVAPVDDALAKPYVGGCVAVSSCGASRRESLIPAFWGHRHDEQT
jgi:hypothetical protein